MQKVKVSVQLKEKNEAEPELVTPSYRGVCSKKKFRKRDTRRGKWRGGETETGNEQFA